MDSIALAVVLWIAICVSGLGWLSLLNVRLQSAPESLGWGCAAGSVWLCLVRMFTSTFPALAHPATTWACLLLPLVFFILKKTLPNFRKGWLGFLPALAVIAFCLWFAAQKPMWNIDALRRWGLHAKWTAAEQTLVPETVQDTAWASTHPSYPPLLPSLLAFGIENGADLDTGLRPFMPLFFLALLGIVYGFLYSRSPLLACPLTFAFACTPAYWWQNQMGLGADAVLADIPLALFVGASAAAILLHLEHKPNAWKLAAIAGAGAMLTKQEGLPLALALLGIGTALAWWQKPRKRSQPSQLLAALGCAFLAIVWWKVLARDMPVMEGENYLSMESVGTLFAQLDRLPIIVARLGQEMVSLDSWGPLWLIASIALLLTLAIRWLPVQTKISTIATLLFVLSGQAILILAYLVSGWQNGAYEQLMETSITRLLLHSSPLVALWVGTFVPSQCSSNNLPDGPSSLHVPSRTS